MSHRAVRLLIRDVAKSLGSNIKFGYGRGSDFNLIKNKDFPFVWLDPLISTAEFSNNNTQDFSKEWQCNMAFYRLDSADSTEEQYQLILDEMDELVDEFINKLNNFTEDGEESGDITTQQITLSSFAQNPFIKIMADYLTGYTLSFRLQVPDDFDYCSIYDN